MAGVARKLLLPHQRFIICLNYQNPLNLFRPTVFQQPTAANHCSNREEFAQKNASQIYPSFSFGYFLNPMVSSGLYQSPSQSLEVKDSNFDESRTMWADSVKKKRKRKMNKHKLRKLRKRLRGHS